MNALFSLAHDLLTLGQDGTPVYLDQFTRLNREVYEQALSLYRKHCLTLHEEAETCLALLLAFTATVYDNGNKSRYVQSVLERSLAVLPKLEPGLLKLRLLTYCYGELRDESLVREAHRIIDLWEGVRLTPEKREAADELRLMEETLTSLQQ